MAIRFDEVHIEERVRKDFGDLTALATSIKEFGLIEPIVLSFDNPNYAILLAGERRFRALKLLGIKELQHGIHYVSHDEIDPLRRKAIELEENIRRKALAWQEEVQGKEALLKLMQQIHGVPKGGSSNKGFGQVKLSAMLGEDPMQTSRDLEVARALAIMPSLAEADTKTAAFSQLRTFAHLSTMIKAVPKVSVTESSGEEPEQNWTLYEGDFRDNISSIPDSSVDLVYTDLPFGVNLDQMSKHTGIATYSDSRNEITLLLRELCKEAYRILKPDRYAIWWFGFNYYTELCDALKGSAFAFSPVPFVWEKGTQSSENPVSLYAMGYDAAIVARKGSPRFVRPGRRNIILHDEVHAIKPNERLQIAQQPVGLPMKFINDMILPGATVVDFMAGSGTTGEAALRSKCKVILFEKDKLACEIIRARLSAIK